MKAFTLVEMLLVMVIMGFILMMGCYFSNGQLQEIQTKTVKEDLLSTYHIISKIFLLLFITIKSIRIWILNFLLMRIRFLFLFQVERMRRTIQRFINLILRWRQLLFHERIILRDLRYNWLLILCDAFLVEISKLEVHLWLWRCKMRKNIVLKFQRKLVE